MPCSKAVRELPAIKYAKKLANQVQSEVRFLENGANWFGKYTTLVFPKDDTGTDEDQRPYLELVRVGLSWLYIFQWLPRSCVVSYVFITVCNKQHTQGTSEKQPNIVLMPFRNHLAA